LILLCFAGLLKTGFFVEGQNCEAMRAFCQRLRGSGQC
jgi:hypothetical protein